MSLPSAMQMHQQHEDDPWTINLPDHEARTDSPGFVLRKTDQGYPCYPRRADDRFCGVDNVRMRHGGSLWLFDDAGWFIVRNEA
jgi:hypothetical protein